MKKTVPPVTQARPMREERPARVQEALGELAAAAREGLLACRLASGSACLPNCEGLAETLTVAHLGITGSLKRTLASTNPCESMIECVRLTSRNVKRWQSGEMALRWTAAGMLEAERQFRRIIGHRDLAKLAVAIERDVAHPPPSGPQEEAGAAQRRAPVVPFAPVEAV